MVEAFLGTVLFDFEIVYTPWPTPVNYANWIAEILLLGAIAFPLLAYRLRAQLRDLWSSTRRQGLNTGISLNVGMFAMLILARYQLANVDPHAVAPAWYYAYCALLLAMGVSLALVAAPPSFWRALVKIAPHEIAAAAGVACFILLFAELSRQAWRPLSNATLVVAYSILGLYEPHTFIDMQSQVLGVQDFSVVIAAGCSGYEGIALVVTFMSIYLWVFRSQVRFPNAYLLFPIGIAAIWLLNSLRIALLVSIGAHLSPVVAMSGFHSWSGWIAFLIATGAIMAATHRSPYIWAAPAAPNSAVARDGARTKDDADEMLALLAPFIALMVSNIMVSAAAPNDQWLYPLKVIIVGATLWWLRDAYIRLLSKVSLVSVVCGIAVGAIWIATDPQRGAQGATGAWLAGLPMWVAAAWVLVRTLGSVVLVPVAEELAFRGYLLPSVMAARPWNLTSNQMRLLAIVVSSVAFGVLHDRWLAATLAGFVYAALMLRSDRLSDPIASHMASNAVIMAWSVAFNQWTA